MLGRSVIDIHRTDYIKYRVKDVCRVVKEIITHTASHRHATAIEDITRVVVGIDHIIVELTGTGHRELLVGVIDQDDQSAEVVIIHQSVGPDTTHRTVATVKFHRTGLRLGCAGQALGDIGQESVVGRRALCLVMGNNAAGNEVAAIEACIGVIARSVLDNGVAVGRGGEMEELITMQ